MDFQFIDKDGEWLAGVAPLGLRDPTTQVGFPYNQPVKVKRSEWVAGQIAAGTIKPCANPLADDPPPKAVAPAKAK